jgi:hypothetical protein
MLEAQCGIHADTHTPRAGFRPPTFKCGAAMRGRSNAQLRHSDSEGADRKRSQTGSPAPRYLSHNAPLDGRFKVYSVGPVNAREFTKRHTQRSTDRACDRAEHTKERAQ